MRPTLLLLAVMLAGCSGHGDSGSGVGPTNATVSGPYTIILTSTKNAGDVNIYANFSQNGAAFTSDNQTLACPSNAVANCLGDDAPTLSFTLAGIVSGNNVTITAPYDNTSGADTATLTGTANGGRITGTYTDTQGDAGNFTATEASTSLAGSFTGTLTSSSNPAIPLTVSGNLTQTGLTLTGSATITNSPCFSSLNFSTGSQIGGAFTLSNSNPNIFVMAVPVTSNQFSISYSVGQDGGCAGDTGTGTLTKQ